MKKTILFMCMNTDSVGSEKGEGSQLRNVLSKRDHFLKALLEEPKTKPEMASKIEQSRSTIDRAMNELLDVGCIEPTRVAGKEFRITLTGELALQTYQEYCATSSIVESNSSLLNALPSDAKVSKTFLSTADVYSSTRTPDIASQPAIDLLPEATKLTGTAPVVFGEYFDVLNKWIQREDSELELVLEKDLFDAIEQNYRAEFATMIGSESVEIHVLDDQIPYALWLIDCDSTTHAGITVYEDGGIKGTMTTDTTQAVRWAKEEYNRYKQSASRFV